MQKVTGIGGFFFRAKDTKQLAIWYETHLGINPCPSSYDEPVWNQESGETVFAPFAHDTDYFGDDAQQWMINFRVEDINAMVEQLKNANIEVEVDSTKYPNGHFARLSDPEGNPIQLWQPSYE